MRERKPMVNRILSYYARPQSARTGGVNTSRQQWMYHLAEAGFEVTIVAASGGFTEQLVQHPRIQYLELPHYGRGRMTMVPKQFKKMLRPGDLVYLHEGWTPSNVVAARHCKALAIPYVVLPHGVYEPQIVDTLRSFPGRHLVERWVLENAEAVHMFFEDEIQDLRRLAPSARAVVAMTGMPIPDRVWSAPAENTYLAWLGRYDVKHKGIDNLLHALASLPETSRPVLQMRGPDYFGGKAETEQLVRQLRLESHVVVGPEISGVEVEEFFLGASAFVHVPRWEAFGRTILECLALGVPLILGDGARVAPALREAGAAHIVASTDVASIAEGLIAGEWSSTSVSGRAWALKNASWPSAVNRITEALDIVPTAAD